MLLYKHTVRLCMHVCAYKETNNNISCGVSILIMIHGICWARCWPRMRRPNIICDPRVISSLIHLWMNHQQTSSARSNSSLSCTPLHACAYDTVWYLLPICPLFTAFFSHVSTWAAVLFPSATFYRWRRVIASRQQNGPVVCLLHLNVITGTATSAGVFPAKKIKKTRGLLNPSPRPHPATNNTMHMTNNVTHSQSPRPWATTVTVRY